MIGAQAGFIAAPTRANCVTNDLPDRNDRRDPDSVAGFPGGFSWTENREDTIDALLSIGNFRAAKADATAGLSCAFGN